MAKNNFNKHVNLDCGGLKTFSCPYYPRRSSQKGNLRNHVLKVHKCILERKN